MAAGELQGRTIVITGASSGIGAEAARQLAALGATVCLVARRAAELREVSERIRATGGSAQTYVADLTDPASLESCCAALLRDHARIDVLINNAGRSIRRPLRESANRPHDFERTIQINYLAAVRMTLALLPRLLEQGGGQIINVSSVAALMTTPRFAAYLASKAALDAFTRSLRIELAEQGIVATTIHYPLVRTAMIEPTKVYKYLPQLEVPEAARWLTDAVRRPRARRAPALALAFQLGITLAPAPALQLLARFFKRRLERAVRRMEQDQQQERAQDQNDALDTP